MYKVEIKTLLEIRTVGDAAFAAVSMDMWNDPLVMGTIIALNPKLLNFYDSRADREDIMTVAVELNYKSLKYASLRLQDNMNVVLTARKNNFLAIQYASPNIQRILQTLGLGMPDMDWNFDGVWTVPTCPELKLDDTLDDTSSDNTTIRSRDDSISSNSTSNTPISSFSMVEDFKE